MNLHAYEESSDYVQMIENLLVYRIEHWVSSGKWTNYQGVVKGSCQHLADHFLFEWKPISSNGHNTMDIGFSLGSIEMRNGRTQDRYLTLLSLIRENEIDHWKIAALTGRILPPLDVSPIADLALLPPFIGLSFGMRLNHPNVAGAAVELPDGTRYEQARANNSVLVVAPFTNVEQPSGLAFLSVFDNEGRTVMSSPIDLTPKQK